MGLLSLRKQFSSSMVGADGSIQGSMASPALPAPTVVSCGDSPLSTTSSVVGILTFALGLLASYIALQSATRGAPSEIARLVDDLRTTQRELNRVAEYIFDDAHNAPTIQSGDSLRDYIVSSRGAGTGEALERTDFMQTLYDEVQELLGDCIRLFYEADDLLKKCESDVERWDPEGLRRRIIFVMNRHEVADKMQRLNDQKARLGDVRMSLFLRKSKMQDAVLKQMSESLKELKGQQLHRDSSYESALDAS
ncbi:hypothetical protein ACLMJK_005958 [Lecanora helva]